MDDIILMGKEYSKGAVKRCENLLCQYGTSVIVDNIDESYGVYRYTHKNYKLRREKLFTLECKPEGFGESVKYIIIGDVAYPGGAVARNLLTEVLVINDKQIARKAEKLKQQQISPSVQQVKNQKVITR